VRAQVPLHIQNYTNNCIYFGTAKKFAMILICGVVLKESFWHKLCFHTMRTTHVYL